MKTFFPFTKGYRQWILLGVACSIADQVNTQAGQGLSEEEKDTLRRLLLRVADNLSETQEDTE